MKFRVRIKALLMAGTILLAANGQAGELRLQVIDADAGVPLADVVMEVVLPQNLRAQYVTPLESEVDQQEKEFVASVTVITTDSLVRFPNSDDILHHVYSFSEAKVFELPLYGSGRNINYQEKFELPGVVELGCNIHDWMLAHIYVAETDFAAVTDATGTLSVSEIPAGTYAVKLWHPRASADDPALLHEVTITDGTASQLRVALTLNRDNRLRRAPGPSRSRYR